MISVLDSWRKDDGSSSGEGVAKRSALDIIFTSEIVGDSDCVVIFVNDQLKPTKQITELGSEYENIVSDIIKSEFFKGELYQIRISRLLVSEQKIKHVMVVGIGNIEKLEPFHFRNLGGAIHKRSSASYIESLVIYIGGNIGSISENDVSSLIASGALLASYRFDKYLTQQQLSEKFLTNKIFINVQDSEFAQDLFKNSYSPVDYGVLFCRDLANEPPNILYPETYSDEIEHHFEQLSGDVVIKVLDETAMKELGMMALLGVGRGSAKESRVVIMEYDGLKNEDSSTVCIIGKGVTFDTGGISLKPSLNMDEMKYDMAGSAAVVGTIKALALRKAKVKVVGIIGLVENMPGGNAQRPGDIVKSASGKTIEIGNTDAEGRLVLADCLWYAQENYKNISCIIDIATLTGAITVALGDVYAGFFTYNDELSDKLLLSSRETNEKIWRMPLHEDYDKLLKSSTADMNNISGTFGAGSSVAAHFLAKFIKLKDKWAHIDIANVAWNKNGNSYICSSGAVGFGVRLLEQFIRNNHEVSS